MDISPAQFFASFGPDSREFKGAAKNKGITMNPLTQLKPADEWPTRIG
jgi:hypothetical protein